MVPKQPRGNGTPGPGVDAAGRAVVDPSTNVFALVEAETRRQDDLREQGDGHVRELLRERDKRDEESTKHAQETRQREAEHAKELRDKESERIDAIRSVDVQAVQRAAEVAAAAVQALAAQVPITADAVRTSLAQALDPIQRDVIALRQAQYEQQGQKAASVETKDDRSSASMIRVAIVGAGIAATGLFVSIAAVVVTFILAKP